MSEPNFRILDEFTTMYQGKVDVDILNAVEYVG